MTTTAFVTTYVDAAREFGVRPHTIGDLAKVHGLEPKPVPGRGRGYGNAKGLDARDMRILRTILSPLTLDAIASQG